jgi:hypothetical protein
MLAAGLHQSGIATHYRQYQTRQKLLRVLHTLSRLIAILASGEAAYAPVDLPTPSVHLGSGRTLWQGTTLAKDPEYATMSAS